MMFDVHQIEVKCSSADLSHASFTVSAVTWQQGPGTRKTPSLTAGDEEMVGGRKWLSILTIYDHL